MTDDPAPYSTDELRRRAQAGIVVVAGRGAIIAFVGLLSQLVLARLLFPADFGAVAFGLTVVAFVNLFCDGGLGAGLIRREEPPTREELSALSALQVSLSLLLSGTIAAVAPFTGHAGVVTAVIVLSAPLLVLQIPARIVLERELRFDRVARVEVVQVLVFNVWAVTLVLLGAGVWGLATAPVVRSVVGLVLMTRASPVGTPFPHFSWARSRSFLHFGMRFQVVTALTMVREQGLNVGIALVSGLATLGFVTLARRVLEIPQLVLQALWRVSFPAVSQLVVRREPVTQLLERAVALCATGLGLVLVGLAAGAPGLVPGVFGDHWEATADLIPPACLGLGIAGPVSVACQGYLFAVEDTGAVIRAGVAQSLALFATALPLLPVIGLEAVAVGWLVSYVVEAGMLAWAARRHTRAALSKALLRPVLCGLVGGAAGWAVADRLEHTLLGGLAGSLVGVLTMAVLLLLVARSTFVDTVRFVRESVRAARPATPSGPVVP